METVLKATAAYFVLLLMLRVTGRRTGKRTTTFEILLIFLLGGQMTQAILADDRSFTNAFLGVSTVAMCHTLVAWWKTRSPSLARVVDGVPLIIFANGKWEEDCMNMVRVQREDVLQHAREEGLEREDQIRYVIVERNGALSIIKREKD
ncbi:MAG TPA: YetF domain-containing protein [Bryobacteraceae bacterium]|nr:YetF domain-containing protein [Bryobacteraceae bacterium]